MTDSTRRAGAGRRAAVFLDRDGVLIEDVNLISRPDQARLAPGAAGALERMRAAGFALVVITNQPVVARGLASEADVAAVHEHIQEMLREEGSSGVEAYYTCFHHPSGNLPAYRLECDCRKPQPGLILRAANDLGIDLSASYMVGDRQSDIVAGHRAGCRTVLVETGMHLEPPIESPAMDLSIRPDAVRADLPAAADWILADRS